VVQETRHFDEMRNVTVSIRSKVGAHDYRYFPECDLVTLRIASWVPAIKATLPELPDAKRERFVKEYGLADDHAKSLTSEIKVANFYEAVAARAPPKLAAVWIADVLKGELNYRDLTIDSFREEDMIEIVNMLAEGKITEDGAVEIIRTILNEDVAPEIQETNKPSYGGYTIQPAQASYRMTAILIVEEKGLGKAEDDIVQKAVREAVAENATAVADYKAGSERALNFIVGQVMKKTKGKASPGEVHKLVKDEVEKA
jgi:aspartyl-tRNA(Asn)/glutamyl-tRNA(Gln) amidotransferase subunit B